jgi:hypothetical protein
VGLPAAPLLDHRPSVIATMRSTYERTIVLFVVAAAFAGLIGSAAPGGDEPARPAVQAAEAGNGGTRSAEDRSRSIH